MERLFPEFRGISGVLRKGAQGYEFCEYMTVNHLQPEEECGADGRYPCDYDVGFSAKEAGERGYEKSEADREK